MTGLYTRLRSSIVPAMKQAIIALLILGAGIPAPSFAQDFRIENFKSGSGFFVDGAGHIVTNAHVVASCSQYQVRGVNPLSSAELIATDVPHDLALLKISTPSPAVATLSDDMDYPQPDDAVYTIGYPGENGAQSSATFKNGNITKGDEKMMKYLGLVTFASPTDKGSSGGPVLNESGQVIGVIQGSTERLFHDNLNAWEGKFTPQGLAIVPSVLHDFLKARKLALKTAAEAEERDMVSIEREAARYTVQVICH